MAITLHVEPTWVSPYVFATFVALKEKGLAFEVRELDASKGETKAEAYLAQTLTGRVPSLVHDDFAVAESSAIVEYLDDVFPSPAVLPRGLRPRARTRQLLSWMRSDETAAIRRDRSSATIFYGLRGGPLADAAKQQADKLFGIASRLLEGGRAHVFDAWSLVDAELAFLLMRLVAGGDDVPDALRAYAEAEWQRPSVRAYVEHPRPPYVP